MLHCGIEKGSNFIPFHSHNELWQHYPIINAMTMHFWGSTIWPIVTLTNQLKKKYLFWLGFTYLLL